MHWSKSRHTTFANCPRQFFYSEIAARRNPDISALIDRRSPPLVRHDIVRSLVISLAKSLDIDGPELETALNGARSLLLEAIEDPLRANTEFSIVDACVRSFVADYRDNLHGVPLLYTYDGSPIEFSYGGQAMMCLPEIVLDRTDVVEILALRTGVSHFRSEHESRLRAGGLVCWARSALGKTDIPTVVSEIYLREGCTIHQETFTDSEVTAFVQSAKETAQSYSSSARIRDFPAKPDHQGCRFCAFTGICPEHIDFAEGDYRLAALSAQLESAVSESPDEDYGDSSRVAFLSHSTADKEAVVRPVARALEASGISFWLDEAEIKWGDSLIKSVNEGLSRSNYMVCFLSKDFCNSGWPEAEMNAALSIEFSGGGQRVLPVIIGDKDEVLALYPLLRDKKYICWTNDPEAIVSSLKEVLAKQGDVQPGDAADRATPDR